MKIGVISDTHDHCDFIERFLDEYEEEKVEMLIHLGDIVAPFAAKRFERLARKIPFIALYGNNDGERAGLLQVISQWGTIEDGPKRIEAGGKVLILHHYPMKAEEVLSLYPDADYYLFGHTHERSNERVGRLRLLNPGEACGWLTGIASMGILDLDKDKFGGLRYL